MKKSFGLIPLTMKVTLFMFFFCAGVVFANNSYAQKNVLNLKSQTASISEILSSIEKQTGFTFFYDNNIINVRKKVHVKARSENVFAVLDRIFEGTNISYKVMDRNIILMNRPVSRPSSQVTQQKENIVRGTVVDDKGQAIIGASVTIPGSKRGCITDINGNFSIKVDRGETLLITYIGYQDVKVTVGQKNSITVTLKEATKYLNEVVVVGYGIQKKSDITGAISSVKTADIEHRTITHVEEALEGKTAGVQLLSVSAQPGSSPSIRIRGFSSNGTSDPLYVVDGLIVSNLSAIDPNNIQSMEVLKDAASAAIYGAQAGNGVVLITTKSGSKGSSSITYEYQNAWSSLAKRPKLLNSEEALGERMEQDATFTQENVQQLIDEGVWDGKFSTNWYDVAFTTSPMYKHTVNMQGANDRGSFFLSFNYLNDNGIIRKNKDLFRRFSVMGNADYKIKTWLKVGFKLNYDKFNSKTISDGSANSIYSSMISRILTMAPYWADTYAPDALPTPMKDILNMGYTLLTDKNGNYYSTLGSGESVHPMVAINAYDRKTYGNHLMGTIYANLTPIKDLVFTSRLGFNETTSNYYSYSNDYYGSSSVLNLKNTATRSTSTTTYYQLENFFNYNKTFGDHNISLMGGMSYSRNDFTYVYASVDNVSKDDSHYADVSYPSGSAVKTTAGYNIKNARLSYFGRIGYSYQDKYMVQGILRADAADTSILPKENRWGYFPSVSLGWTLSNEDFFKNWNQNVLSFAKFRASWGHNGSTSNLSNYKYSNSLTTTAAGYSFSDSKYLYTIAAYPSQTYNPNLKWETSEQFDLGLDVRALKDRFTFTLDLYKKKTKDLIVSGIVIPYEVGNTSAPMNSGSIENKGVELELGWKDKINDFQYSISANLATLSNKVTYLNPNVSGGRILGATTMAAYGSFSAFEVGYPIWYFRGYEVDHLDEKGAPVFVDRDNNGAINENDKTKIGKPMPDYTYGITLTAAWKGIDLIIFGNGTHGNDIFQALSYNSISYSLKKMYDQRWTADGTTNRKYAAPSLLNADKYLLSNAYIFDGSYFRIKQIQLGYTFPHNLTQKIQISNLRAYVSLDNFFTFTKYPGLDPEVSATSTSGMGVDYGNYPTTKKVVFGVSVTF
jgi:TonB-linked SusC/RagA family outer membrane protein